MPDVYWSTNDLRALAEEVDSVRNKVAYVVEMVDQPGRYTIAPLEDIAKYGLRIVMECMTTDEESTFVAPNETRKKVKLVSEKAIKLASGELIDINDFDAIFTSLSAVEKFVVPYYARFTKLPKLEKSRDDFAKDPFAAAVLHTPKSVSVAGKVSRSSLFTAIDRGRGTFELDVF